jgi:hypothetical protein
MYLVTGVQCLLWHADKQILLKMVTYWPKHVKDNKLKHQHLSITLNDFLKILYTITSLTDQDEATVHASNG